MDRPQKRDDCPEFWDDVGCQLQERKKAQNESMLRFWLSELFDPADSELATFSLSLEEFVAGTGGIPSDVDKREYDRRARIQSIEEDDAVF